MKKLDVLNGTLAKLLEAEIANVKPMPVLGDDDSINLSEWQEGYIRGLQLAKTHLNNVHAALKAAPPAVKQSEEMVPCPARKCGTGHGFCGLCGTAGEATRSEAETYAKHAMRRDEDMQRRLNENALRNIRSTRW